MFTSCDYIIFKYKKSQDSPLIGIILRNDHDLRVKPESAKVGDKEGRMDPSDAVLAGNHAQLRAAYNVCVQGLHRFRELHLGYAVAYIHAHAQGPDGTGGTPFMTYLRAHLDETLAHLI